jgi:glycogen debranching enzyme
MIDDDFLLAPVAADYLLDESEERARAFLDRRTAAGEPYGAAFVRNLMFVVDAARPFVAAPDRANLIHLKPGRYAGDWRDSEEGLGRGRTPYNVNAVLVPAALEAAARLHASGLLDRYLDEARAAVLAEAGAMAAVWAKNAPAFFRVRIDNAEAREKVAAYAGAIGALAGSALDALGADDVVFNALALDADGEPIPVLHSDESFLLAFCEPPADMLERAVEAIMRPFPAGLMTPAGLLVANAAYAPASLQGDFSNAHYHGAVVWSWQQALFAAGLDRQLRRDDLDEGLRAKLEAAQRALWAVIEAGEAVKTSELWSWSIRDGAFVIEPFGQRAGDVTESNAAQLWSAVYLGVRPPDSQ